MLSPSTRLAGVHIADERDRQVLRRVVARVEGRHLAAAHGVQVVLEPDHRPSVVVAEHPGREIFLNSVAHVADQQKAAHAHEITCNLSSLLATTAKTDCNHIVDLDTQSDCHMQTSRC